MRAATASRPGARPAGRLRRRPAGSGARRARRTHPRAAGRATRYQGGDAWPRRSGRSVQSQCSRSCTRARKSAARSAAGTPITAPSPTSWRYEVPPRSCCASAKPRRVYGRAGGPRLAEPLRQAVEEGGARLEAAVCGDSRERHRKRPDDAHLPDEVPALGVRAPTALELHVLAEDAEPPALLGNDAAHAGSNLVGVRKSRQRGHQLHLRRERPLRLPEGREARAQHVRLDPRRRVSGRGEDFLDGRGGDLGRPEPLPEGERGIVVGRRERRVDQLLVALGRLTRRDGQRERNLDRRPGDAASKRPELLDGLPRGERDADLAVDRRRERLEARPVRGRQHERASEGRTSSGSPRSRSPDCRRVSRP